MTRRNLVQSLLLAGALTVIPVGPGPFAQAPATPAAPPAAGTSEPSRGPDSKDLFESIHVVVGPSARALDPIAELIAEGRVTIPIAASYPIEQIREAVAFQAGRHAHGKVVITL